MNVTMGGMESIVLRTMMAALTIHVLVLETCVWMWYHWTSSPRSTHSPAVLRDTPSIQKEVSTANSAKIKIATHYHEPLSFGNKNFGTLFK